MLHISEIMFCVFAAKTFHRGKPSVFHISEIIFCVYAAKTIHKGRPSKWIGKGKGVPGKWYRNCIIYVNILFIN